MHGVGEHHYFDNWHCGARAEVDHNPDRVVSRLGTLEFNGGAPSDETAALLHGNLDFQHEND